nr:legumin B-like [Tanacetum cinerariifolium]
NAHNVLYVKRGNTMMQIANNKGQAVFDDVVQVHQVVMILQNFVVLKQAQEQGCQWIAFRTNDNSMINTLAGHASALRVMPLEVIATLTRCHLSKNGA